MVGNNATVVQRRLDEIRAKGRSSCSLWPAAAAPSCPAPSAAPKFICLNDDMNKTHAPPAELLAVLRDFYESYFPKPSPFELPEGQSNPALWLDELPRVDASSSSRFLLATVVLCMVALALAVTRLCGHSKPQQPASARKERDREKERIV